VEGLTEDVAVISEPAPRFSFLPALVPGSMQRGVRLTSYRITVAKISGPSLVPLWDSGDVNSSVCSEIAYLGPELPPFTRCKRAQRVPPASDLM
jgi:hypothetical protein